MPQFARPDSTIVNEGYVNQAASATNPHLSVDEASADDADYVVSPLAPTSDAIVFGLSDVTDPVIATGHIVRYRYAKNAAAGGTIGLVVELRQGYVNEGTPGTLIATNTHANISETITAGTFTLSSGEANAITDYTALSLRFVTNQT